MKWETVTDILCELGEGPVWDAVGKSIIWVDIDKGNIHQYYPDEGDKRTIEVGQKTGAVALKRSGGLVAALEHGFAAINLDERAITMIANPGVHVPGTRFNDGKCDPSGRFWAGTMPVSGKPNEGSLYTLEKNGTVSTKIRGIGCPNGLAWSFDRNVFYFIDTTKREVAAFEYSDTDGSIQNKRVLFSIPEKDGLPDGMTIDAEGKLWIAIWGGWKVERWDPVSCMRELQVTLPVSQVSSCTFGGNNLDDLYITSARTGLSKEELRRQPLAGSLFVIKNCGYNGMPAYVYNG